MCVWVCTSSRVCVCVCAHVHMCVYMHTRTCVCVCARARALVFKSKCPSSLPDFCKNLCSCQITQYQHRISPLRSKQYIVSPSPCSPSIFSIRHWKEKSIFAFDHSVKKRRTKGCLMQQWVEREELAESCCGGCQWLCDRCLVTWAAWFASHL